MCVESYNCRLYKHMLQLISDYKKNKLPIDQLIADLEGLNLLLQDAGTNWNTNFFIHWALLEEVYAVSLDRNEGVTNKNDLELISKSLENLEIMITHAIEKTNLSA